MRKYWIAMIIICMLLVGCSGGKKETSSEASKAEESSVASQEESVPVQESKEEESSVPEESSVEESSEESIEESIEESSEESVEESSEEPVQESSEEPVEESSEESVEESSEAPAEEDETLNRFYAEFCPEEPEEALAILYNEPEGEVLYSVPITDEFNVMAFDHVLILPKYTHMSFAFWSLKTEMEEVDGEEVPVQVHDELIYECKDTDDRTAFFSSIERVEDAPKYALEIKSEYGNAEYIFTFHADGNPEYEYIVVAPEEENSEAEPEE